MFSSTSGNLQALVARTLLIAHAWVRNISTYFQWDLTSVSHTHLSLSTKYASTSWLLRRTYFVADQYLYTSWCWELHWYINCSYIYFPYTWRFILGCFLPILVNPSVTVKNKSLKFSVRTLLLKLQLCHIWIVLLLKMSRFFGCWSWQQIHVLNIVLLLIVHFD